MTDFALNKETSKEITTTNEAGSKTPPLDMCSYTIPRPLEPKTIPVSTAAPAPNICPVPTGKVTDVCSEECAPQAGGCFHRGLGEQ